MIKNYFMNCKSFVLVIFLICLLLLVNVFSQPQNWVHFFQEGGLNDPMTYIMTDDSAIAWAIKLDNDKMLCKINVNEGFDCKTNFVQFISEKQYYSQFAISNDDNCIYLFSPDSICKIDKNNASNKTTVLKLSEPKQFASAYEVRGTGIYVTCYDGSVYLYKNNSLNLIGIPIDSTKVFVQIIDSQNRLWFKSASKGIFYYKNSTWCIFRRIRHPNPAVFGRGFRSYSAPPTISKKSDSFTVYFMICF